MYRSDPTGPWTPDDDGLGELAFHNRLPHAIRSLDDHELRAFLVALLKEWRARRLK